jgi:AraC-like DNA-binding protein
VTRNPKLEAYLEARWDLDQCEPGEKPEKRQALETITADLLQQHRAVSERELAAITADAYRDYCRARRLEAMKRLSRLL